MGYSNETTHYGLPLPTGSDLTTPMDYNESLQDVDTALFEAVTDSDSALTKANGLEVSLGETNDALTALTGRVTDAEGTIITQGQSITNLGNKITDVNNDITDAIEAKKEATATASRNYAIGDYFWYNNVLYRATEAITSGQTIVPDTNCTTTNVMTEVSTIKTSLTDSWHYVVGTSTDSTSWLRYKVLGGVCYVEGNIGPITMDTTFSQFINDNTLPTPDGKAECTGLTGVGLIPLLIEITALGGVKIAAQSLASDNYATFCLAYPVG